MPLSRRYLYICLSLLAASSLSAHSAETAPEAIETTGAITVPTAAPEVTPSRPLTLALLMPTDNSNILSAMHIVQNGLAAASRMSMHPANILLISAQDGVTVESQLQAAALSGADVAIGPLDRNTVEKLTASESLPLPTLALNAVTCPEKGCPEGLGMLAISAEHEAEWGARLAAQELAARVPAENEPSTKAVILVGTSNQDSRIGQAYARTLVTAGIDFDIVSVNPEALEEITQQLEPKLSVEDEATFKQRATKLLAEAQSDDARSRIRKNLVSERRAQIVTSAPPYQAAFLALSAQEASFIRSRLPMRMRLWATFATNPGDPQTSSTSATLAYDLNRLIFTDCPLLVKYGKEDFEAYFGVDMPFSPNAKRLFALGFDAFEAASRWATLTPSFSFSGETGTITFDSVSGPLLSRTPQTVYIRNGELLPVSTTAVFQNDPTQETEIVAPTTTETATPAEVIPVNTL